MGTDKKFQVAVFGLSGTISQTHLANTLDFFKVQRAWHISCIGQTLCPASVRYMCRLCTYIEVLFQCEKVMCYAIILKPTGRLSFTRMGYYEQCSSDRWGLHSFQYCAKFLIWIDRTNTEVYAAEENFDIVILDIKGNLFIRVSLPISYVQKCITLS